MRTLLIEGEKDYLNRNNLDANFLSYLVSNLTRWTTHLLAFSRLLIHERSLKSAIASLCNKLVEAQIGAATGKNASKFRADAEAHIDIIEDVRFWRILGVIKKDLEPIAYFTNIMQADKARPDEVIRGIAGIWLHFTSHSNVIVRDRMTAKIEHRWRQTDIELFLSALILNPYDKLALFGPKSKVSPLRATLLIAHVS